MPSPEPMPRIEGRDRLPLLLVLAVMTLAAVAIWAWDLDRGAAQRLRELDPGDTLAGRWWCQLLTHLPAALVAWLAALSLALAVRSWRQPRAAASWRFASHPSAYILGMLALGPGLLVNVVLKLGWGRPRPRSTLGFGGEQPFSAFWEPGQPGQSFPSGHVAMVAIAAAMWWVVLRPRRPALAAWGLAAGLTLALATGGVRMLSRAHWLSDVVLAIAAMSAVALASTWLPALRWPPGSARTAARLALVCAAGLLLKIGLFSSCDTAIDVGLPAPVRSEPVDLEVRIAGHPVVIVAYASYPELIHVDGNLFGYGPLGTDLRPSLVRAGQTVRVDAGRLPWTFRRSGEVWVRIDPTRFRSITVTAVDGDLTIGANPGTPIGGMRLSAPRGRIILPDWAPSQ